MNNKNKTLFAMIIIGYIVVLMAYVINVVAENRPTAIAENKPTAAAEDSLAIECGSCGAHVYEWWYVENINDGKSVEVCELCYSNYVENAATE